MEWRLALVLLASVAVNVDADCCYKKNFTDGSSFTLLESGSQEVDTKGCDTAGGCVYQKDGTSDRYCFKRGGQEVPGCENAPCDEYVVISTDSKFITESVDVNSTCVLPSFDKPSSSLLLFVQSGQDFYILDYDTPRERVNTTKLQTDGSWKTMDGSHADFPKANYALAPSKSMGLLAVGGKSNSGTDSNTVFQLTDGTWTKMSFSLKDAIHIKYNLGCAVVTDDDTKLITVGGGKGQGSYDSLVVYEIADGSSTVKNLGQGGGYVTSCAYVDNVVYFYDGSSYNSYDVKTATVSQLPSPAITSGYLTNFRGKLAIFGGNDKNLGSLSEVIKVFDNNNWNTEIAFKIGKADFVTYVNK